jgi:hypothetical protein
MAFAVVLLATVLWLDREARKQPTDREVELYLRDTGLEDTEANRDRAATVLSKGLFRR